MDQSIAKTPEREAFYRKIDGDNLTALWNVMGDLITSEPKSPCRPHLWHFDAIRGHMMEAGKLISAKEGERRVLSWRIPDCGANPRVPLRFIPASSSSCLARSRPRIAPARRHCASSCEVSAPMPR